MDVLEKADVLLASVFVMITMNLRTVLNLFATAIIGVNVCITKNAFVMRAFTENIAKKAFVKIIVI